MKNIKKFNQFNSPNWIGPVEILRIDGDKVFSNFGELCNKSETSLRVGYSYLLRLDGDDIIETGMSCVDLVIFVKSGRETKVLSILRGKNPFLGMWANPGGNIDEGEEPIEAAVRELWEETGIKVSESQLKYVGKFDNPWRDPRNKNCISHAFVAVFDQFPDVTAGDDAKECRWNSVDGNGNVLSDMAFDHAEIIKKAFKTI